MKIVPVIICLERSSLLWPLSRKSCPSYLLPIHETKSSFQHSILNTSYLGKPIIVCSKDSRFIVAEQLSAIGITPHCIILHPAIESSAPAVATAAIKALDIDRDSMLLILNSDYIITNNNLFQEIVHKAFVAASNNKMVLFGVDLSINKDKVYDVNNNITERYLATYYKNNADDTTAYSNTLNSGKFIFKSRNFLEEFKNYDKESFNACSYAMEHSKKDIDFLRLEETSFKKIKDLDIKGDLLDNSSKSWLITSCNKWFEINNLEMLWGKSERDSNENDIDGDIIIEDCKNCSFKSEGKLLAGIGLKRIIAINTKDALLIASKDNASSINKIVKILHSNDRTEHLEHRKVLRPWGCYESLESGYRFQVKRITVKPNASLSLQMHHHRSEHWVIVEGSALVTLNSKEQLLTANESIYIPIGTKHRLTNPGKINLEMIEVQIGCYLGEDDIIRFDDVYGRCN